MIDTIIAMIVFGAIFWVVFRKNKVEEMIYSKPATPTEEPTPVEEEVAVLKPNIISEPVEEAVKVAKKPRGRKPKNKKK